MPYRVEIGGVGQLLTPEQVALAFGVSAKTVTRWADTGRLATVRTVGGHRRFHRAQVEELLNGRRS
jgi:excisionase family DNA binding protein